VSVVNVELLALCRCNHVRVAVYIDCWISWYFTEIYQFNVYRIIIYQSMVFPGLLTTMFHFVQRFHRWQRGDCVTRFF